MSALFETTILPERARLPDPRNAITHKFDSYGHEGYLIVGFYEHARPGGLFIKMANQRSTISRLMDAFGILTTLALQYGVPVEALARRFQHLRFKPSGCAPNAVICDAHTVTNYVFRWLGFRLSDEFREEHDLSSLNGNDNAATTDQLNSLSSCLRC